MMKNEVLISFGSLIFALISSLFYSKTVTVRAWCTVRDKCNPVAGFDNMVKWVREVVAKNSLNFIKRQLEFQGNLLCLFTFRGENHLDCDRQALFFSDSVEQAEHANDCRFVSVQDQLLLC